MIRIEYNYNMFEIDEPWAEIRREEHVPREKDCVLIRGHVYEVVRVTWFSDAMLMPHADDAAQVRVILRKA